MSVIIKDMEMPEDCFSCPLKEEGFCNITNAYAAQIYKRNSDCPLVELPDHDEIINSIIKPFVVEQPYEVPGEFYMSSSSNTNQRIIIWIVTYWDFDQEPVVTPFNNRENAEKCWTYFKKIHDGCCLDECEVFTTFLSPEENRRY